MTDEQQAENAVLKKNRWLFWMCFISLVTTAFFFAVRAQIIGAIGFEFDLSETEKGWLMGAGMWPFALGIIGFSLIIDRIGYKTGLFFAFACHIIATIMILIGPSFWWLFFGNLIVAVGNGTVEAVINPAVASLFTQAKTKWLNILHAGWAGGILLGSLISLAMSEGGIIGRYFTNGLSWRWTFGMILIPALIYGAMLIRSRFPVSERVKAGVSFKDMLKEMGIIGFAIVILLFTREIMNILANISSLFSGWSDSLMLGTALLITCIAIIPLGVYIRSFGRGLFIVLVLLMLPLATTELGTDTWIKELMNPVMRSNFSLSGGWVLVYSSLVMMVLRFNVGPVVKRIGPLGLMASSSLAAAIGLVFISNAHGAWIILAATVYAIGQTFFWPTMLGIVAERFPKGGAVTLNSISGIGMLGVGILGAPLLGLIQDKHTDHQLMNKNSVVYKQVVTQEKQSIYGHYRAVDPEEVQTLDKKEQTLVETVVNQSKRYAMTVVAIVPLIMAVSFLILIFWFRKLGGYKPVELAVSNGGEGT
ncbi:MFS transporter [bacterium]|nr:MFS transporter [bacterium]